MSIRRRIDRQACGLTWYEFKNCILAGGACRKGESMRINSLKRKWWAKLIAALLLFIMGVGCIASLIGAYYCSSYGVYDTSREGLRERMNREMLSKYSVTAMANYVGAADKELSPNYHYAIFEGSGTTGKKVAGDLEAVPENAVIHEFVISDTTSYRLADSMFNNAYVQGGSEDRSWEEQIQKFYYCLTADENNTQITANAAGATAEMTVESAAAEVDAAAGTSAGGQGAALDTQAAAEESQAVAGSQTAAAAQATDSQTAADAQATDSQTAADVQATDSQTAADAQATDRQTAAGTQTEAADTQVTAAENQISAANSEETASKHPIELYVTGQDTNGSILYRVDPKLYRVDEKKGMLWLTRNVGGEVGVPGSKIEELFPENIDIMISPYTVDRFYFDDSYGGQIENAWFRAGSQEVGTVYTVAGVAADKLVLTGNWVTADFFEQVQMLLGLLYKIRFAVFAVILICFILGLLLFIFLMMAAGHRGSAGDEGLVDSRMLGTGGNADVRGRGNASGDVSLLLIDRMPMDLALAVVLFFSFMCAALVLEMWDIRASAAKTFCAFGVGLTLSYIAVLAFCMSFAVNVKVGGWWGRTVICRLWKLVGRFFRWFWRMLGVTFRAFRETMAGVKMGKRAWALFALFVFCEFVGLVIFRHAPGFLMFFWLIEKIIFFLALMKILLDFGKVKRAGAEIAGGNLEYKVETEKMLIDMEDVGNSLNTIGNGITSAVEERMKSERMKTELITNVSHDIKTPLTSIINYTDLLTKLDLKDPKAQEYLEVLGRQSARLKKLIEDLIEASKASSGALKLDMEKVNASMLLMQALGEYEEKFRQKGLDLRVTGETSEMMVRADSRYLWRIFDNLMSNMLKYAQAGTRAYIDMSCVAGEISIIFRNISETPLNITGDELMERFVRGDSSRSTEGSGLGLSIADSLVALMGGTMEIVVDGDLFKVIVRMPAAG